MTKNVVITGTSRGIGFELAKQFIAAGHSVLALSRNMKSIEALATKKIHGFSFDITKQRDIDKVAAYVKAEFKQVDILIHNAGTLVAKPLAMLDVTDFESVYKVNVFGVAMLTKALVSYMPKKSHVVTISSVGGIQGSVKFPGLAAYSSSKGAVITLSELLAEEYKEKEIAFNVMALGAVQTEMLAEAFPDFKANVQPDEMASHIMHFALTGQQFYNGKVIEVSNSTP
ncbi:SDR family NAD(P)-dependent oxidoreductase [Aquimarina agarivorans]|uniref:SDR family NAD(P)-dependent oxidoreductase n=1 Tax=Aquimarina agarivorans TaxID=980584 RepID=UPI000248EB91|nr:SDR family oxidoreductase [Aquimarina agarivorans]